MLDINLFISQDIVQVHSNILSHLSTSLCMPDSRCSLWDDFTGNVATFNVYKWRDRDVIV